MKDAKPGSTPLDRKRKIYRRINIAGNILFLAIGVTTVGYNFYNKYRKDTIYNSLDMSFMAAREIEYGTDNYDVRHLIANIDDGVIKEYTKDVDTSEVGVQKVKFEIGKDDVSREFNTMVEVVDTKKPVIEFKSKSVTIYKGTSYNLRSNIKSVHDEVDGEIKYASEGNKDKKDYYIVTSTFNKNKVGTYKVIVNAYDKNGNSTTASYNLIVKNKAVRQTTTTTTKTTTAKKKVATPTYNGKASVDTSSVVATAKSFVGYRYVFGGASPKTGFDCSGLVKYVYSLHGKKLGHGTYSQAKAGQGVSRSNMQPGDVIVWSTKSNNAPTHVSIYIGGGQMVHAANTRDGVITSSVSYWESHGGGHIVTIRRI